MKKAIMGKKEISHTLLDLADKMIGAGMHKDTDFEGRRYANAHATFLIELAKSYLIIPHKREEKMRRKPRA